MTRESMLAEIDETARLLRSLRVQNSSDGMLEYAEQMLAALRVEILNCWPLKSHGEVAIGRFAVRAFDDDAYPELVTRLVRVDSLAKGRNPTGEHEGSESVHPPQ
jgi:hypothetical protein